MRPIKLESLTLQGMEQPSGFSVPRSHLPVITFFLYRPEVRGGQDSGVWCLQTLQPRSLRTWAQASGFADMFVRCFLFFLWLESHSLRVHQTMRWAKPGAWFEFLPVAVSCSQQQCLCSQTNPGRAFVLFCFVLEAQLVSLIGVKV